MHWLGFIKGNRITMNIIELGMDLCTIAGKAREEKTSKGEFVGKLEARHEGGLWRGLVLCGYCFL